MAVFEDLADEVGRMGFGSVVKGDVGDAFVVEARGEDFRHVFGAAVHGGVNHDDAFLFFFIGTPEDVFFEEIADIGSPYGAVEGADALNIEAFGFFQ